MRTTKQRNARVRQGWHRGVGVGLLATALGGLLGCTPAQRYASAQAWQQQECLKTANPADRARCTSDRPLSHDDYQRQANEAKDPK